MIGLDGWSGFFILLIIPLLYWQQKRASAQQEIPLSLFPVLARLADEEPAPSKRFLQFSRNQRFLILTMALLSLALSFNGIHISREDPEPGNWLIVLDNTPGSAAQFEGGTVLSEMVTRLKVFSRRAHEKDQFTLMVTSPSPEIFDKLDRKNFRDRLSKLSPAATTTRASDLQAMVDAMQKSVEFKEALLVSARSESWRNNQGTHWSSHDLWIPPEQSLVKGNVGFIAVDITPVFGNLYDIYGRIVGEKLATESLEVSINQVNRPSTLFTVDLAPDGTAEFHLLEVSLQEQVAALQLEIADNLATDNRVTITRPENLSVTNVLLSRNERGFLRLALSAFQEFNPLPAVPSSPGQSIKSYVSLLDRTVPEGDRLVSPTLVIFPPEPFGPFQIERIWTTPLDSSFHPGHPATRNARFRQFRTAKILEVDPPPGFKTLASAQGIPLILAGTIDEHRVILWTFDPEDNGIYLDPAFPVLLRDTVMWLTRTGKVQIESESCIAGTDQISTQPGLCASLVREAASISIPILKNIADDPRVPRLTTRKELGNTFLILALVFLLILAAERALYREVP